jgi:limonene-1,2-epoxide hydrolase
MLLKECHAKLNKSATKSAKQIVMEYLQATERRDFKSARSYITDNISYREPIARLDGAEPYLNYLEQVNLPPLDIKKEFADSNDVCLLYDVTYGEPPVTTFVCGWFHVNDDGKISSIKVVFDPRPFVQPKE